MKKLLLVLLALPLIGFGQSPEATESNKQIIKIKPSSLLLGDLSISYEREIVDKHSLTIGIPFYFNRDIANMQLIRAIAPLFDENLYDNDNPYNSEAIDILDDAEGIGEISGYGFNFKYKFYINKNTEALTGFYVSPEYLFRKFNIKIDASASDINEINEDHFYPSIFDNTFSYELDGFIKTNIISFNFGHQWIRDWFSIDMNIGLAHYNIMYDFEEESRKWNGNLTENDEKDKESIWLPRVGLNLGVAF